ncbi:MAG: GtrA family protein [Lachnospiraceae bacterium]|nr:GtrA family protein [Lachnospiraceae bacterium]
MIKLKKTIDKFILLIKFSLVGIVNTMSSLIIYYILLYFNVHYNIAIILGYIGSSIIGYFLNRIWVFQARKNSFSSSLVKYYIVYISALLLNLICMHLWIEILSISNKLAPLLTLCITIPYNFLLSKLWVFKESGENKNEKRGI